MRATPIFVHRCDFIIELGKPKLFTEFEVASFGHYRNIKRDPQLSGAPVAQSYSNFFSGCDFMMGLGKLYSCRPNLTSLASAIAKILKENHKFQGATQAHVKFMKLKIGKRLID